MHLKEAKDLPAADGNGLSDPYAVLKLGKESKKSMIQYDTLNPQWNEKFEFVKVKLPPAHTTTSAAADPPAFGEYPLATRIGSERAQHGAGGDGGDPDGGDLGRRSTGP